MRDIRNPSRYALEFDFVFPLSISGQIDWHAWLTFLCVDFFVNTSFGTPGGTESFNMVDITDKSELSEENYIPIPEDKLKEDQKKEYEELVEKFKRECLKSYSCYRHNLIG